MNRLHQGGALVTPILAGELITTASEREQRAPRTDPQHLTPREVEILSLVQGRTNRQIASTLGIEEKTVKNHISSVYSKLHVASRLEAMAVAPPDMKR